MVNIPDWILPAFAGGLGGAVRAFSRPEESWSRRITTSAIGSVVSVYGTPVAAPIIGSYLSAYSVPGDGIVGLCGFLLGMTGLSLAEGVIRLARNWAKSPEVPPKF